MCLLQDIGIVKGKSKSKKVAEIFESLEGDFRNLVYNTPSEYIKKYWNSYITKVPNKNNSQNGKIFEYILATLLYRENIMPFYMGAKVSFVADINFDIMMYSAEVGPLCISAKTTLRERYKQSDFESLMLKDVHKGSKSYLVTLDENFEKYKSKLEKGHIRTLNGIIHAHTTEFDLFIEKLKTYTIIPSPSVKVIDSKLFVQK